MSVPCPKCGAESDDVGSKYVCGECYWVFDKGSTLGAAPMRPSVEVPTPQRPTMAPQAPRPTLQPAIPSQAPAPAPAPSAAPSVCPKCSGNLINMSGKFVCEKCFHSVDMADPAQNPRPGVQPTAAPLAPAPGPVGAPAPMPASIPTPGPVPAPYQAPAPAPAAATVCPKCSGNLVDIGGKAVCEKCFHTVDDAPATPTAPAPMARPSAPAPLPYAAVAASPSMSAPTPVSGNVCPKCSGNLMDISGKLVCEQCYHVVDTPSAAPAAKSAMPFAKPAAPAFTPPTVCPKCSGSLMDVGGKYVCDACYHVVDTPGAPLVPASSGFTPRARPTDTTEEGAMSPAVMGGGALIILLILMIVVLAIRH